MVDDVVVMRTLDQADVPALLAAFDLGPSCELSNGPVASGRLGSIWRLNATGGTWAVKQVGAASDAELTEVLEGAAFQEAAIRAGIRAPEVRRTRDGDVIANLGDVRVRVHGWVDMAEPDTTLDAEALGRLLAGLHRVDFDGGVGVDPWYSAPVGRRRWEEIVGALRARQAPFADELDLFVPELVALESYLGRPPRALRTCHRDLWADNVRRTAEGNLCVFDFDNAGLADPAQELAAVLVEYAGPDAVRARSITAAYEEAGGPGRVEQPDDFAMPIAQLSHIAEEGCRRWLASATDAEREDNESWVREFLDRPLTRELIETLLSG